MRTVAFFFPQLTPIGPEPSCVISGRSPNRKMVHLFGSAFNCMGERCMVVACFFSASNLLREVIGIMCVIAMKPVPSYGKIGTLLTRLSDLECNYWHHNVSWIR